MLGLDAAAATPVEVMRAILRMKVDLLWNGGIGTYVKAADESHGEVRDRANDAIRADGNEIRAKVLGEGGNLGCTQRGRVEYAQSGGPERAGGRINTDFIDNSAGVNTSDLEVNIKILLADVARKGRLTRAARDKLLASMTGEVAALVLRNNYLQSQAISVLEQRAPERLSEYQSLIRTLERGGHLNRAIEFLPADDEFPERRKQSLGLTRPELAVVLAYSKIWLSNHLLDSDLPDDPYFASEVQRYFPTPARKRYAREIPRHRLRREIIATATTNSLVNRMGPVFVARAQEDTDADPAAISRAYTIAREIFSMRSLWADIEALDNAVGASVQYAMLYRTGRLLRHTSYWLLRERGDDLHVEKAVRELRAGVGKLTDGADLDVGGEARVQFEATMAELTGGGVPEKLARRVARLALLEPALDIVALSRNERVAVADVARVYFGARRVAGPRLAARRDRSARGRWSLAGDARARACATPPCARIVSSPSRFCARAVRRESPIAWRAGARSEPMRSPAGSARSPKCARLVLRTSPRSPWASTRSATLQMARPQGRLALVITTYERPDALAAVLASVSRQTRRAHRNTDRRRWIGILDTRGHRRIHRARKGAGAPRVAAARRAFASVACAISRSPRRTWTTWCSSTATCCCIRISSPIMRASAAVGSIPRACVCMPTHDRPGG